MLIIKFEIPLIENTKFDVIKITPVPVKIGEGLFRILVSDHDMVAFSADSASFALITEAELDHCVEIPAKGYAVLW